MHISMSRQVATVIVAILAVLLMASPVAARQRVDPATLNPPPPPEFHPVCFEQGHGIVCDISFDDPPFVDQPSGVVCGGVELIQTNTRRVIGKRFYNSHRDLLQRHFLEIWGGSFTNPDTGLVAKVDGIDTVLHNLAEPGNDLSGTRTTTGVNARIKGPNGRTILLDAGRMVEDVATGAVLSIWGPHPFYDYFALGKTQALQPLCDALD